jgi:hypothetical protein
MENEKKEFEFVEAEVVEEKVETEAEKVEAEVIETPVSEEVEVIEHELDVTIEEETYVEYFKSVAFKAQIKPTLFFGVVVVLLSYFFRGENVQATEALLRGLLWGAVFVVLSIGLSFITMPRRAKSTYAKSGVQGLVLHTSFSNLGVRQSIEDQTVLYRWEDINQFVESDKSYFGHMLRLRKIILMSKKNMSEEDVQKINAIIVEHLGPQCLTPLNKKKEN